MRKNNFKFGNWENEEAEKINKETDPIWSDYFFRWQQETKSSVRLIRKEI